MDPQRIRGEFDAVLEVEGARLAAVLDVVQARVHTAQERMEQQLNDWHREQQWQAFSRYVDNFPGGKGPLHIHVTDIVSMMRCPRQARLGGRLGLNLRPVRAPRPLVLGEAYHAGMEVLYREGDLATAQAAADNVFLAAADKYTAWGGVWYDDVTEEFTADRDLCRAMIENYTYWATPLDKTFDLIDTERHGTLPIPGIDPRDAVLDFRIDGVSIHRHAGTIYLREYKTAKSIPDEQKRIEKDLQARVYCWAAQQLLGRPVAGIEYRFARKSTPQPPAILKNGTLSKAVTGAGELVTADLYRRAFTAVHGLEATPENLEMHGYGEVIKTLDARGNPFFTQYILHKTQAELDSAMKLVALLTRQVLNYGVPDEPRPDWYKCTYCSMRQPCDYLDMGRDITLMLKHDYRSADYVPMEVELGSAGEITLDDGSASSVFIEGL